MLKNGIHTKASTQTGVQHQENDIQALNRKTDI